MRQQNNVYINAQMVLHNILQIIQLGTALKNVQKELMHNQLITLVLNNALKIILVTNKNALLIAQPVHKFFKIIRLGFVLINALNYQIIILMYLIRNA